VPDGTVDVTIRVFGDTAVVIIADSGPGFGRIRAGNGVGLLGAACHIIAGGGTIELRESESGGAKVSIRLPVAPT